MKEKQFSEVSIHFKVPKNKAKHIFNARDELNKAGITFDTGGYINGKFLEYDWEFDWSLRGSVQVRHKRFNIIKFKDEGETNVNDS